jgi:PIN domain nuclease of toxin-antitoxin system
VRGLLDTHTLIWASVTPERLGAAATKILQDRANELYVSLVSMWEISVKVSKPKNLLTLPHGWNEKTEDYMAEWGLSWLPIRLDHCRAVGALPWRRHRDPFDRMLIAQAQVEQLSIVTADPDFKKYDVKVVW